MHNAERRSNKHYQSSGFAENHFRGKSGVDEGVRTLDRRSHNPELYQLSYVHHIREVPYGTHLLTSTLLVRRVRYQSASSSMARPAGLEPATIRLEGGCSIQLSYGRLTVRPPEHSENGRGREIRTPDILLPKQARYQTALYPVCLNNKCLSKVGAHITGAGRRRQHAFEKTGGFGTEEDPGRMQKFPSPGPIGVRAEA